MPNFFSTDRELSDDVTENPSTIFSFCVCGGEVIRGFFFFFSGPDAGALMRDIWHDFLRISCHVGRERVKAN